MPQRVNIQYSIDIEDLEVEVIRMLKNMKKRVDSLDLMVRNPDEILSIPTIRNIEKLRVDMASIDLGLRDINAIINGYISHQTQTNIEAAPQQPDIESNVQALQEQLESLQKLTSNEDTA